MKSPLKIARSILNVPNVFGVVIITCALCVLPFHAYAGVFRSQIIEYNGKDTLKIEPDCPNSSLMCIDEVIEGMQESVPDPQFYRQQGYVNQTGIEVLTGRQNTSVRFQMVHGYQFHPVFAAGIGTGFTTYNDPLSLISIFLDLRLKLIEGNSVPIVFLKTGYNISVHHDERMNLDSHNGGIMINPGIGVQFDTSAGLGLYFHAGYNIDEASFEQSIGSGQTLVTDLSYKRIHFGMGLSF